MFTTTIPEIKAWQKKEGRWERRKEEEEEDRGMSRISIPPTVIAIIM